MDLNSRLFDSIRIKPTCDEPKPAAEAGCESPGCTHPGLYRAPKGRKADGVRGVAVMWTPCGGGDSFNGIVVSGDVEVT